MNKSQQGKSMTYAVAINSSGQATIPKAVRDLLNVVPGKNRLIFNINDGQVSLSREPSREEQLLSSLDEIHRRLEREKRLNPQLAVNIEKHKEMSFEEIRNAYDATPEGKKEFEEKYGIKI